MGWLDQVPRVGKLFIGGLHALYQKPELFREHGITHILSVIDFDIYDRGNFQQYKHFQIRIEDEPNENLLQHFKDCNAFIDDALNGGGAVFVHCAMGKSRSAALCCAYLMWEYGKSLSEALAQICESRPVCGPNPGFLEQLDVYSDMLKAGHEMEAEKLYQRWLKDRYIGDISAWEKRRLYSKL